jgi:hypothetical protein
MGDAAADHLLTEHSQMKGLLAQLDTMTPTDPNFDTQVRAAAAASLQHIAEEESSFLPRFGALMTPPTLLQMGIQFEAAKVRDIVRYRTECSVLGMDLATELYLSALFVSEACQCCLDFINGREAPTVVDLLF